MQISRRNALMGATAAAIVTGAATAPLAIKATLAGDPVIELSQQLRGTRKAWYDAIDVFEEAAHRGGRSCLIGQEASRELGIEPLWQERERYEAQFWDLQARLLDMPATTPGGVVAKLRGFYHDAEIADIRTGGDPVDPLPSEFAASIYRDLERLSGGLPS